MKLIALFIASVLAVGGATAAAATLATPAAATSAVLDCDNIASVKDLVACGTACVGQLASGGHCGPQEALAATPAAAGPDLEETVQCVKYAVGGIVGGHPQPCPI